MQGTRTRGCSRTSTGWTSAEVGCSPSWRRMCSMLLFPSWQRHYHRKIGKEAEVRIPKKSEQVQAILP